MKTIPNFKKRVLAAAVDPVSALACRLHEEGYSMEDVLANTSQDLPEPVTLTLYNYMRDIQFSGTPIPSQYGSLVSKPKRKKA